MKYRVAEPAGGWLAQPLAPAQRYLETNTTKQYRVSKIKRNNYSCWAITTTTFTFI